MFDNVCKFLAESFSTDFANWLLGKAITLTELSPSELSLEPIRADALILLQSDDIVLHLEFQTEPKADIPFRMTDYRLRVYRRFPHKKMHQVVIYLQPSKSELVQQTEFILEKTRHEFDVIRLWEQPTEIFLGSPGLLPFATLSKTEDKAATLEQVSQQLAKIDHARNQSNVAASTAILAGLVLNKELIRQLLRRDFMRESVIYQDILHEGEFSLVMRQLRRRVGTVTPALQLQIQDLPLTKLEDLGEALLDFSSLADLETWLAQNQSE
ncbi:MAG TPA: Rpn family recombination-promoting nuclease/putative transposase [Nostocaceae cyanobacterium]|nr:Rpn family recombination-promoting nuclease/putative transposase [Nostocaceae cyanobacterium]